MRELMKLFTAVLLLLVEPVHAHPGHGTEYSLATLVVLIGVVFLLVKLYRRKD